MSQEVSSPLGFVQLVEVGRVVKQVPAQCGGRIQRDEEIKASAPPRGCVGHDGQSDVGAKSILGHEFSTSA